MCNAKLPQGCTFLGDCLSVEGRVCEGCPHYQQPTQMPLQELSDIDKELLAAIKGHVTFQCGCGEICQACENTSRDIMHSILERDKAHDSAIASKAVKEFVEKVFPILEDSFLALFAAKSILWNSREIYYLNTTDDYRKLALQTVIETLAKYPEVKKLIDEVMRGEKP